MTKSLTERDRLLAAYERAVRSYGRAVRVLAEKHGDEFVRASHEADRLGAAAKDLRLKIEAIGPQELEAAMPLMRGGPLQRSVRVWLEREEQSALEKLRVARRNFGEIVANVPSGLPASDGILRIQQAAAGVRILRRKHNRAAKRLLDYLANGTIPADKPDAR